MFRSILGWRLTSGGRTPSQERYCHALHAAAERTGAQIKVAGQIPVLFSDYNIQNPSLGGFVTTADHGLLEFLLVFNKA